MGMDEDKTEELDDALDPQYEVNPSTGLPYAWGDEDELAGWESIPSAS